MALSGSIALGSSHSDGGGDSGSVLAAGDLLLVGAAVLWSIETVLMTCQCGCLILPVVLCIVSCSWSCKG